jgi:hypothetical protein
VKRVNVKAAFVGEPTASQEGLQADDDDADAVILTVRGGELTLVVPANARDDALVPDCSVLRGTLRMENERVLTFEIHEGAVGAFFEDEPTHLHDRREAETAVGLFSGAGARSGADAQLARDIMTSELVTVGPTAPIKEATDLLAFHGISGVLVCENERLLGVVSEADIISRFGSDVSDIMTREVVTVPETMPIRDVADLLVRRGIKRAPVMRDGRVVGLISRADLVRWLAAQ